MAGNITNPHRVLEAPSQEPARRTLCVARYKQPGPWSLLQHGELEAHDGPLRPSPRDKLSFFPLQSLINHLDFDPLSPTEVPSPAHWPMDPYRPRPCVGRITAWPSRNVKNTGKALGACPFQSRLYDNRDQGKIGMKDSAMSPTTGPYQGGRHGQSLSAGAQRRCSSELCPLSHQICVKCCYQHTTPVSPRPHPTQTQRPTYIHHRHGCDQTYHSEHKK